MSSNPRATIPPNYDQFTKHLVNLVAPVNNQIIKKVNVTRFSTDLAELLQSNSTIGIATTEDNLDRIRVFKDAIFYKLRGCLDSSLLEPLSKSKQLGFDEGVSGTDLLNKSEEISSHLRASGNTFFKKPGAENLKNALRCYTLACSYAPKGSKLEALAYSNRSACYLQLSNFTKCLEEIERFELANEALSDEAKRSDDFKAIPEKVMDRKQRCLDKMKDIQQSAAITEKLDEELDFIEKYFKLSDPSNAIPCVENFISIKEDSKRGRYVCNTGEVIKPGTLIGLEEPYSKILVNAYSFNVNHCRVCLEDLHDGGIPCESCIFALYCSEDCASSPEALFHTDYECKIAHFLYELNMDRLVYLSLMTLLTLGLDGVISHFVSAPPEEESSLTRKRITGFSENGVYDSLSYWTINKLVYHDEILKNHELIKYCSNSVILTEILDDYTDFFSPVEATDKYLVKDRFSSLLLLHQLNFPCNAHSLYWLNHLPPNPTREEIRTSTLNEIGSAAFSLLSMINHSCDPNVVRITLSNGNNALVAIRHIVTGQEILDNYGVHYATDSPKSRRKHLQDHYNFTCFCPACKFNWPNIDEFLNLPDNSVVKICANCKLTYNDDFDFKYSKLVPDESDKESLKCLICSHKASNQKFLQEFETQINQYNLAGDKLLDEYDPLKAFAIASKCVEFFDANCMHPFRCFNLGQEIMKQALNLLVVNNMPKCQYA